MKNYLVGIISLSLLVSPISTAGSPARALEADERRVERASLEEGASTEYDYDFDEPQLEKSEEFIEILEADDDELLESVEDLAEAFEEADADYDGDLFDEPQNNLQMMNMVPSSWKAFRSCVANGVAKAFGINILKKAVNGKVVKALKSHRYKKASAIIHKNLSKYVGRKSASSIIKYMARRLLPGGIPGILAWQVGKCGVKQLWGLSV